MEFSIAATKIDNGYDLSLRVKNTGHIAVGITAILFNGKYPSEYKRTIFTFFYDGYTSFFTYGAIMETPVMKGETYVIRVNITGNDTVPFTSGDSLTITLHTHEGNDFYNSTILP